MTWKDEIKKRKLYISSGLAEEAKMFLKDIESHLDSILPSIEQEFDEYSDYDRERIEKVILYALKDEINNIKRNLKNDQVILAGLEMKKKR